MYKLSSSDQFISSCNHSIPKISGYHSFFLFDLNSKDSNKRKEVSSIKLLFKTIHNNGKIDLVI